MIRRIGIVLTCLCLWCGPSAWANQRINVLCADTGRVNISGISSTNQASIVYPYCTITVYLAGTTTLATIYSDNGSPPTILANPFQGDNNGSGFFYAALGRYDITLSGSTMGNPVTIGDVLLQDIAALGGGIPGGNSNELQWNNAGHFAGTTGLTWDGANVSAPGNITTTGNIAAVTVTAAGVTSAGPVSGSTLTATSLPVSTSPVCPNGASGALTTLGCITGAGTVNASAQFQLPIYDQAGIQAHLNGDSRFTDDGNGNISAISMKLGTALTPTKINVTAQTVASLPTSGNTAGDYREVNDAASLASCATGGGVYIEWCYWDGSSWKASVPLSTGAPGGATGELQYNNGSGGFAATSGMTWSAGYLNNPTGTINASALSANQVRLAQAGEYTLNFGCVASPCNATNLPTGLLACTNAAGFVAVCSLGTNYFTGLVLSQSVGIQQATITLAGIQNCTFDNTATSGDWVVASTTTAGQCHDAGSTYPNTGLLVGQVNGTGSGGAAPVFINHAGPQTGDCSTTGNGLSCLQAPGTLTDFSPIVWASGGRVQSNASVTLNHLTGTRNLAVTGLQAGAYLTLVIKQDSTGGANMGGGAGCTWYVGGATGYTALGAGNFPITTTANNINILAAYYDGTNCYANVR